VSASGVELGALELPDRVAIRTAVGVALPASVAARDVVVAAGGDVGARLEVDVVEVGAAAGVMVRVVTGEVDAV